MFTVGDVLMHKAKMNQSGESTRSIRVIAGEIARDWKKPYFGAVPYLQAMASLESMGESYGCDPAKEIVQRFLCNAGTWRGETAKRVKAELNAMLKRASR